MFATLCSCLLLRNPSPVRRHVLIYTAVLRQPHCFCLSHHLLERHSVMTVLLEDLAWQPALPLLLQACLFTLECLLKGLSIDASMYTSLCQYRSSQNAQHLWN